MPQEVKGIPGLTWDAVIYWNYVFQVHSGIKDISFLACFVGLECEPNTRQVQLSCCFLNNL